jgi:hypothetical protein
MSKICATNYKNIFKQLVENLYWYFYMNGQL